VSAHPTGEKPAHLGLGQIRRRAEFFMRMRKSALLPQVAAPQDNEFVAETGLVERRTVA